MATARRAEVDVNLGTVEAIEAILREAGVPVTRYYLRKTLGEMGRSTTPERLNRALDYLLRLELAFEGSKGIQWVASGNAGLRAAAATGRKL